MQIIRQLRRINTLGGTDKTNQKREFALCVANRYAENIERYARSNREWTDEDGNVLTNFVDKQIPHSVYAAASKPDTP